MVAHRASFSHLVPFSREEFISYLLTRSNTLDAIDSEKRRNSRLPIGWAANWCRLCLTASTGSFIFKCNLWLLRKTHRRRVGLERRLLSCGTEATALRVWPWVMRSPIPRHDLRLWCLHRLPDARLKFVEDVDPRVAANRRTKIVECSPTRIAPNMDGKQCGPRPQSAP